MSIKRRRKPDWFDTLKLKARARIKAVARNSLTGISKGLANPAYMVTFIDEFTYNNTLGVFYFAARASGGRYTKNATYQSYITGYLTLEQFDYVVSKTWDSRDAYDEIEAHEYHFEDALEKLTLLHKRAS